MQAAAPGEAGQGRQGLRSTPSPAVVSLCPTLNSALISLTKCIVCGTGNTTQIHLLTDSNFGMKRRNKLTRISKRKNAWEFKGRLPKPCYSVTLNFLERNSRGQVWRSHTCVTPVARIRGTAQNTHFSLCYAAHKERGVKFLMSIIISASSWRAYLFLLGNRLASQVMNIGNCLPFIFAKQQKLLEVCPQVVKKL